MMGISTAILGLLLGSATWGDAAPSIPILLRVLQGSAVGGEWTRSVLLSMERGEHKRRGLMGSGPQLGMPSGLILSTGLMALFNAMFGKDAFIAWGFRIPFLLSLVHVAIGLYIRLKILETPMFRKVVTSNDTCTAPLLQVFRKFPKEIALSALLRISEQMPFYVVTAFVLSYMTSGGHGHDYTYNFVLIGTLIAAGVEFVLVPLFGQLSDTIGRKKIYAWGAAVMGIWGFVYFALLDSGVSWLAFLALFLGLIPHAM